jgi:DNA modification methylase
MGEVTLYRGDCLDILPTIESASVDCIITDPPYPHIKRDYGTWTTEQWWTLIVDGVIPEVRRILKPTGSAVFILQPNSEHVGQMRGWLFEFQAWVCREWNMAQDVYWWNVCTMPEAHSIQGRLMRPSVKPCVWCGPPTCYRDQEQVLWSESQQTAKEKATRRISRPHGRMHFPGGHGANARRMMAAADRRGGVSPYNMLPFPNSSSIGAAAANAHTASTPLKLADWWTRYICPPGGTVLDPFVGSGTMMLAAIQNGCNGIGIDKEQRYIDIARQRIEAAQQEMVQARMTI